MKSPVIFNHFSAAYHRISLWKKILATVIIFILILTSIIIILNTFKQPNYKLAKVTKEDIVEIVAESGSLTVNGKVDIYSPTNGIIEKILVANGDIVSEKQPLFVTKSTATDQEKQAAYASYLTAKSTLEAAQATLHSLQADMFEAWDTYYTLAKSDLYERDDGTPKNEQRALPEFHIAQKDWYAAEANYKNQQTVISKAQAQVNSTWLAYQATQNITVKSPITGTVSNVSVIPGSNILVYSLLAPATPVLSIGDFSKTEARILFGEDDVVKIKTGQEAEISVDAVDNKTYKGVVQRIDTIGTEVKGVVRYSVYIEILDPDEKLRPGMNVDVNIVTNKLENVLTVLSSAVKPYKGGKAVRVPGAKKGEIIYVPVQVGIRGDKNTQIIDGLREGQTIITSLTSEEKKKTGIFGF